VFVISSLFDRGLADIALRRISRRSARVIGVAIVTAVAVPGIAVAAAPSSAELVGGVEPRNVVTPAVAQQAQRVDAGLIAAHRAAFEAALAAEAARRAAEAEALRPKSFVPVLGMLSSTFGIRWGAMHAGIDFADRLGTPIASVTDGVVIEAGPASGFGLWVRVQQDDGTIGVYGHVNDIFVGVGQPVRAGDIIATVGNRGQSTGPHLHYEVWLPGNVKIDPLPWFAARGINVSGVDLAS